MSIISRMKMEDDRYTALLSEQCKRDTVEWYRARAESVYGELKVVVNGKELKCSQEEFSEVILANLRK